MCRKTHFKENENTVLSQNFKQKATKKRVFLFRKSAKFYKNKNKVPFVISDK